MSTAKGLPAHDLRRGNRDVLDAVCETCHVPVDLLLGPVRSASVARARQFAMLLLRERGLSYPEIGRALNRDHTTVMAGEQAALRRADRSPAELEVLRRLRATLTMPEPRRVGDSTLDQLESIQGAAE